MNPTALSMQNRARNKMTLTEEKKILIEKIGIFHEQAGLQPAAARTIGLLLVSAKPALAFDEIVKALGFSKSATSNAINLLIQTRKVDYTTYPGDRKRYFRLKASNWRKELSERIAQMTRFSELLQQVLEVKRREASACDCHDLDEAISFMDYLHQEFPNLLLRWEKAKL